MILPRVYNEPHIPRSSFRVIVYCLWLFFVTAAILQWMGILLWKPFRHFFRDHEYVSIISLLLACLLLAFFLLNPPLRKVDTLNWVMTIVTVELLIIGVVALTIRRKLYTMLMYSIIVLLLIIIVIIVGSFMPCDLTRRPAGLFVLSTIFLTLSVFYMMIFITVFRYFFFFVAHESCICFFLFAHLIATTVLLFIMYHAQLVNGYRHAEIREDDGLMATLLLFCYFILLIMLTCYTCWPTLPMDRKRHHLTTTESTLNTLAKDIESESGDASERGDSPDVASAKVTIGVAYSVDASSNSDASTGVARAKGRWKPKTVDLRAKVSKDAKGDGKILSGNKDERTENGGSTGEIDHAKSLHTSTASIEEPIASAYLVNATFWYTFDVPRNDYDEITQEYEDDDFRDAKYGHRDSESDEKSRRTEDGGGIENEREESDRNDFGGDENSEGVIEYVKYEHRDSKADEKSRTEDEDEGVSDDVKDEHRNSEADEKSRTVDEDDIKDEREESERNDFGGDESDDVKDEHRNSEADEKSTTEDEDDIKDDRKESERNDFGGDENIERETGDVRFEHRENEADEKSKTEDEGGVENEPEESTRNDFGGDEYSESVSLDVKDEHRDSEADEKSRTEDKDEGVYDDVKDEHRDSGENSEDVTDEYRK